MKRTFPFAVKQTGEIGMINPLKLGLAIVASRQFTSPETRHAELTKLFTTVIEAEGRKGVHFELRDNENPEVATEPLVPEEMATWCIEYDAFAQSPEGKAIAEKVMGELVAAANRRG